MEKCPNCGAPMEQGVCSYCGTRGANAPEGDSAKESYKKESEQKIINEQRRQSNPNVSSKSKSVTLILVILFGIAGFHCFYAGKVGRGILYFLTAGIFGFGWIYDIYKVASGQFVDGQGLCIQEG